MSDRTTGVCSTLPLERYLPLFDPDAFADVAFFRGLERIGYRQVLLGGTGAGDLPELAQAIKQETSLEVVLVPSGPASVTPHADLVVLPDVMNTDSHFARPFGSGAVSTALNVARHRLAYIPAAYFIMGESTARWYFDAFPVHDQKLICAYATYARMVGYRCLALDYEGSGPPVDLALLGRLAAIEGLSVVVSSAFSTDAAAEALAKGVHTVITPSDVYEEASDPLALAADYSARLLADRPRAAAPTRASARLRLHPEALDRAS